MLWLVTFLGSGVALSGVPQSRAAAIRSTVRAALAFPADNEGIVKCGFDLCAAAYRIRATAPASLAASLNGILSRYDLQKERTLGHFAVHYDTSTTNTPALLDSLHQRIPGSAEAFVDSVLAIANAVYVFEIDTLGYLPPPDDGTAGGGPQYDIYVIDLGSEYGETTPETQLDSRVDGGTYTTYMTIDNDFIFVTPDSNRGLPALRVTLAHEFHHAIQLGHYGFWMSESYFYELTSTWMETMAFPAVTDYLNYVRASWGQFKNPGTPFASNDLIMYSRSVWATYLSTRYGRDIMREIWEEIHVEGPLAANATILVNHGTSFASVFSEWNLWNYYTADRAQPGSYYPRGSLYPRIASTGMDFAGSGSGQTINGTLPSLSARYYDIASGSDTGTVIVTNLDAATALNATIPQRSYTLTLSHQQYNAAYERVVDACYYTMAYDDPTIWKSWVVSAGSPTVSGVKNGIAFPNPYRNDGTVRLSIPADAAAATLRIYDSAMQLVYENDLQAGTLFGKRVFSWDGMTMRGNRAASGVYYFTLEFTGGTMTGKFAILRTSP